MPGLARGRANMKDLVAAQLGGRKALFSFSHGDDKERLRRVQVSF